MFGTQKKVNPLDSKQNSGTVENKATGSIKKPELLGIDQKKQAELDSLYNKRTESLFTINNNLSKKMDEIKKTTGQLVKAVATITKRKAELKTMESEVKQKNESEIQTQKDGAAQLLNQLETQNRDMQQLCTDAIQVIDQFEINLSKFISSLSSFAQESWGKYSEAISSSLHAQKQSFEKVKLSQTTTIFGIEKLFAANDIKKIGKMSNQANTP